MKKIRILFTILLVTMVIAPNAFCAEPAKVGVFYIQKVLDQSSAGKLIKNQIKEKDSERKQRLTAEQKPLDIMVNEIKKMKLLPDAMDKNKMIEKEKEFNRRAKGFLQLEKKLAAEMQNLNNQLMRQFSNDVRKITEEIGKKEGYLLILERQQAGVYYAPDQIDITDAIVKILNEKTADKN